MQVLVEVLKEMGSAPEDVEYDKKAGLRREQEWAEEDSQKKKKQPVNVLSGR